MQIVLNQGQISDLFFNYDNATLAAAYAANQKANPPGLSDEDVREAVTKDAEEFATCYPSDEDHADFVNWLVADFMKRR